MNTLSRWQWEATLLVLILAAGAWATTLSPYYLYADQITYSLQQSIAVVGVLAAGLTVVIVVGEIDISIPAILTLGNILFAVMSAADVPVWLALPLVLAMGAAAGAANGFLVVAFRLPSLAVTLGTMGAYRALALLIGGPEGHAGFRPDYVWIGQAIFLDYLVPASLLLMLVLYAGLAVLMHATVFGRRLFVCGANAEAARFSGIAVGRVKVAAFAIGGAAAALGALVYVGQYQSARADNASDLLLLVVTAVVLGGIDIFGGRGRVLGVLLSLVLLGTLKNGMGLANFAGPVQTLVIGTLLVGSVLASRWTASIGAAVGALGLRGR
jgi:rhamnose transport system permease protein